MTSHHDEPGNSNTSITNLSDDLLWMIFDLIYHNTPRTIKSLARVSKQTRYVALQIQYREVVLTHIHLDPLIAPGDQAAKTSTEQSFKQSGNPQNTIVYTKDSSYVIQDGDHEKATWIQQYEPVVSKIYETTRQITINTTLNWDQAIKFLSRCKNLQRLIWESTYNLKGPIPQPVMNFISTRLPRLEVNISGRHWQSNWPDELKTISSTLPVGCIKSLEYFCAFEDNLLCAGDFSGLKSLHIDRCDSHQLILTLPQDPFPNLKALKLSMWNMPAVNVAKQELADLLEIICPLENLDITCPGRYLGFAVPANHTGLRVLKLRNSSARTFFLDDATEHRAFWNLGIQDISFTCSQIAELTLDMFPKPDKMNRCVRRLSAFSNIRTLTLRIQTRLISSEPGALLDQGADVEYVSWLVDEIVARSTSIMLYSISIEVGDFIRKRETDQRALWDMMLANGYPRRRTFHYLRVEPGLFGVRKT